LIVREHVEWRFEEKKGRCLREEGERNREVSAEASDIQLKFT